LLVVALSLALCSQAVAKPGQVTVRVVSDDGLDTPIAGAKVEAYEYWTPYPTGTTNNKGKCDLKPMKAGVKYSIEVTVNGVVYWKHVTTDKKGSAGQVTFRVPPG